MSLVIPGGYGGSGITGEFAATLLVTPGGYGGSGITGEFAATLLVTPGGYGGSGITGEFAATLLVIPGGYGGNGITGDAAALEMQKIARTAPRTAPTVLEERANMDVTPQEKNTVQKRVPQIRDCLYHKSNDTRKFNFQWQFCYPGRGTKVIKRPCFAIYSLVFRIFHKKSL